MPLYNYASAEFWVMNFFQRKNKYFPDFFFAVTSKIICTEYNIVMYIRL